MFRNRFSGDKLSYVRRSARHNYTPQAEPYLQAAFQHLETRGKHKLFGKILSQ